MKHWEHLAAQWPRLSALLDIALIQPAHQREAWLAALPAEQADLATELRRMLDAQAGADEASFLGRPPASATAAALAAEQADEAPLQASAQIGPYRLVRELGRGGMGSVWLADRSDGQLQRQVALKLPRKVWGGQLAQRMLRERDILATLTHPNIARLYDAGLDSTGRPYLALEYVQGQAIDQYCTHHQLDTRARLGLLLQVISAVAHAHNQLVLHRDLKPANILVSEDGQTHLLDFGIAKLMVDEQAAETALTQLGGRAMTPDYASPEQVRGQPLTTASDVYSLGVVAYGLLCGERPYVLQRGTAAELEEAITHTDIPLASSRAGPPVLRRALRGDLDAILNKALKKDPAQRYPSAEALGADLTRFLQGQPVLAQPDSTAYRLGKAWRRHRLPIAAGAATALALVAGTGVALWQAQAARAESARANAVQGFLLDIFRTNSARQPDPQKARQTTARELLDIGTARIDTTLASQPEAQAEITQTLRSLYDELGLLEQSVALGRRSVALAVQLQGANSLAHVAQLTSLASLLHHASGLEERRALLAQALDIVQGLGDRPSAERSRLYSELAQLHQTGDQSLARSYADRSVADARALANSVLLYQTLVIAGNAANSRDDLPQVEALLAESLRVAEPIATAQGLDLLRTRVQLAENQMRLLKLQAAETTLRTALADTLRRNGPQHLDTLQTRMRLGRVLSGQDRPREALAEQQVSLAVLDAAATPDDFSLPQVLSEMGRAQFALGQLAESEATFRRAIALRDRTRANSLMAADLREDMVLPLVERGQLAEAAQLLQQAAVIRRANNSLPRSASWFGQALSALALADAQQDAQAAAKALDELLAGSADDPPGSRRWVTGTLQRAHWDLHNGAVDSADTRLQRVAQLLRDRGLTAQLPITRARLQLLCARVSDARGATAQATLLWDQAAAGLLAAVGPQSPLLLQGLRWRASRPALAATTASAPAPGTASCSV